MALLRVWKLEQRHESLSAYRYPTLPREGLGSPVNYTGMTWSAFRASDDEQVRNRARGQAGSFGPMRRAPGGNSFGCCSLGKQALAAARQQHRMPVPRQREGDTMPRGFIDAQLYGYSIPANMYAVGALERLLVLNEATWQSTDLALLARQLSADMRAGIEQFGITTLQDGT